MEATAFNEHEKDLHRNYYNERFIFFLLLLLMVLQDTLIIVANSTEASVCGRVPNRRETGGRGGAQMSI